jgi:hypothetical protein
VPGAQPERVEPVRRAVSERVAAAVRRAVPERAAVERRAGTEQDAAEVRRVLPEQAEKRVRHVVPQRVAAGVRRVLPEQAEKRVRHVVPQRVAAGVRRVLQEPDGAQACLVPDSADSAQERPAERVVLPVTESESLAGMLASCSAGLAERWELRHAQLPVEVDASAQLAKSRPEHDNSLRSGEPARPSGARHDLPPRNLRDLWLPAGFARPVPVPAANAARSAPPAQPESGVPAHRRCHR